MKFVYAILEEYEIRLYVNHIHVVGIYDTLDKAKEVFKGLTRAEDHEYWVEEWPLNEIKTKFNVMVVASEDSIG